MENRLLILEMFSKYSSYMSDEELKEIRIVIEGTMEKMFDRAFSQ